ncbi:MAG TPA: Hsp20/alpha crystallin family protein [Steroidobacteraceae bacterium]|nr:Hsp20/alpha crystallin family protein [Steroidobacteraceae bacterium]
MALTRYEPGSVVSQLQDEINRVFTTLSGTADSSGATAGWIPPVDIAEYPDRFELTVDLPGVDPAKVEITLEDGVLSLSGEREERLRNAEGESNGNAEQLRMRVERGHGRFFRRFVLPETVDAERVRASGRLGVLEITIPKQAKAQPRRIKVGG